jgi:hypothetical protein
MIIRDQFGYLHEVPNRQFVGVSESPLGESVYDGFGSPLGVAPFLAALVPTIASALTGLFSRRSARPRPRSAPPPPLPPPFAPPPIAPPVVAPAPQVIVIREPCPVPSRFLPAPEPRQRRIVYRRKRLHRRRVPVRLSVEPPLREQVSVRPSAAVRPQPSAAPAIEPVPSPTPPAPPTATESSGGMGGAFYGPFSFFG